MNPLLIVLWVGIAISIVVWLVPAGLLVTCGISMGIWASLFTADRLSRGICCMSCRDVDIDDFIDKYMGLNSVTIFIVYAFLTLGIGGAGGACLYGGLRLFPSGHEAGGYVLVSIGGIILFISLFIMVVGVLSTCIAIWWFVCWVCSVCHHQKEERADGKPNVVHISEEESTFSTGPNSRKLVKESE